jgi:hypothetical protein
MTNNINPVKLGITSNQFVVKEKQEEQKKNLNQEKQAEDKKQVDSKEVLGYMAAQGLDMVPVRTQKTLDVSKYVNDEQEARIADFMKDFEANYDEAFAIAADEFPGISDDLANDLALSYINASY